jgi:diphthine-ammonia ligase
MVAGCMETRWWFPFGGFPVMNLVALYSGGKDSTLAIYDSIKKGHKVAYTLSMIPKNPESYMFHYPNIKFTRYQSEAMGIKWISKNTKGEKEKEINDLKKALESIRKNIDGVVAGGLASNYQRNRIRAICNSLGVESVFPFWQIDPEKYWKILLSLGFKIMIIGVSCEGLGKEWLGRVIDYEAFKELKKLSIKHRFHLAFEGGEAETFVLDCPIFKKQVEVKNAEVVWNRDSGFYLFKEVKLTEK